MESRNDKSHMGYRGSFKNYRWPGIYHITIRSNGSLHQPLGQVVGDVTKNDGEADAPHVALSAVGAMVEHELLSSISAYYPMIEVQDHVVMPEHLHFIVVVRKTIMSKKGRETHLGQVIAGFKKGCNRKYWALMGQQAPPALATGAQQGKPAGARTAWQEGSSAPGSSASLASSSPLSSASPAPSSPGSYASLASSALPAPSSPLSSASPSSSALPAPSSPGSSASVGSSSLAAVSPQPYKVPSNASTGRPPLFDYGYVDVMPLREGQLETQRRYIRNNPRSRLLRTLYRDRLQPKCHALFTALRLPALKGFLQRECPPSQFSDQVWEALSKRLLVTDGQIVCDTYGNTQLLQQRLLPVVCHRRDQSLFEQQKQRCLEAAATGALLVSAHIAKGERAIMRAALEAGFPVVRVEDNGFPAIYHPSERRLALCVSNHLLIVSPWLYAYRRADETISVAACKAMNCIVQALCRTKDSWWKEK